MSCKWYFDQQLFQLNRQSFKFSMSVQMFQLKDPGFDWSLKGFTPADFAAVGKIGKDVKSELTSFSKVKLENVPQNGVHKVSEIEFKKEKEVLKGWFFNFFRIPISFVRFVTTFVKWSIRCILAVTSIVINFFDLDRQTVDILKEKELFSLENSLMDIHNNPTSETHFDLLVTGNPNSSDLWIR